MTKLSALPSKIPSSATKLVTSDGGGGWLPSIR